MPKKEDERWLRQTASLLGFIMGGLWFFFGIYLGIGDNLAGLFGAVIPGFVILLLTLFSLRFTRLGGWLLVVFGVIPLIVVIFGGDLPLPVLLLLSYPIILEGGLFLYEHYHFNKP